MERARRYLPYGIYVCDDGREVLFNRRYQPLKVRKDGKLISELPRLEDWVEGVIREKNIYFYNDNNPPWRCSITKARCLKVLAEWELEYQKLKRGCTTRTTWYHHSKR